MSQQTLQQTKPTRNVLQRRRSKPRRYRSGQLFGDCAFLTIEHGDQEYQLRSTRFGKLILTK